MRPTLLTSALTALLLTSPVMAAEQEGEHIIVQRNLDNAPPERGPVESINREVKNLAPQPRATGEQGSGPTRAPVYRSLADAAAAGVGVRQVVSEPTTTDGWHWWQWIGLALTVGLGGLGVAMGWAWWRNR